MKPNSIIRRLILVSALALGLGTLPSATRAQESAPPPITNQDLLGGLKNPSRWLTFSGDYNGQRHSPLKQLTPQNVAGLVPQWIFQTDLPGLAGRGIENTPLVVDGTLYVTGNYDEAWALDGKTGRPIWSYRRRLPANIMATVCCGPVNRGFGILGDRLYMGTLDAHLVALDRKTGAVIWDVAVGDFKKANAITAAPLVIKDKVIIGVAGGDFSSRGYIDAYNAQTGERIWHFNTIPMPGQPGSDSWPNSKVAERGGGAVWVTGSYDPALNLVYYGTGNPNPDYYGDDREGDNLYTCSLVALDADTGELRWHFQFTPHDVHDWDSAHVPVQADLKIGGQAHKVIMVANRNGFFYTLDRETGKLLVAKTFIDGSNWAKEIGKDGRPIVLDNIGTAEKCLPDNHGGTNFQPPTFDPELGLFFVTAHETCATWKGEKPVEPIEMGVRVPSGGRELVNGHDQFSALRAIDPTTGERRWEHRYQAYPSTVSLDLTGGVMSTATGLVFTGDNEGFFHAFEGATGKELWKFQTGAPVWGSAAVTYMLDGRQWVVMTSGLSFTAFALPAAPR
ncbi:MAG TPA: PQQ-dependent dehydrogenase, methanol/ethanol family [Bryobacteraceae bacterium]|nr:PQQ-dependent dehydrogenase, methanol/ethanol family [Bryobacteraceae bacterium]